MLLQKTQNRPNHLFLAQRRVDHGVINRTVGPLDLEIILNKGGALMVDGFHQRLRVRRCFTLRNKALHLLFPWSKKKDSQRVISFSQEMLRPSSDNYSFSRGSCLFDYAFRNSYDAVGVEHLHGGSATALVATESERFEQAIVKWIAALLAF